MKILRKRSLVEQKKFRFSGSQSFSNKLTIQFLVQLRNQTWASNERKFTFLMKHYLKSVSRWTKILVQPLMTFLEFSRKIKEFSFRFVSVVESTDGIWSRFSLWIIGTDRYQRYLSQFTAGISIVFEWRFQMKSIKVFWISCRHVVVWIGTSLHFSIDVIGDRFSK